MQRLHWFEARATLPAAFAALFIAGCWPVPPGSGGGGAGGGGGSGGSAGSLSGSDIQVCGGACQKLIACGADLDLDGCKASCIDPNSAGLVQCFRSVDAACNPLSACALDALCSGAGSPSGNESCSAVGQCTVNCGGDPTPTCWCGCSVQASPAVASSYYDFVVCTLSHCGFECGTMGDPTSCEACLQTSCKDVAQKCP